ncbi:MAG: PPA1309 family protein [Actinomycetaceae bacterium]|nr:PPA1309 family protein [Arcanobacterium sp.]MDD7505291.1 PPA1309 family protein [Actinomycetaceae bacterium]MDY6143517.1 PPA1309 family protein [Arcanobacterium sp.]
MTAQDALRNATLEIEQYVARGGWDGPIRVFALVNAKRALRDNPELANELPADVQITDIHDPDTLFSVEQEDLPQADSVNELLGRITWPSGVDGAAISMERIVVPPSVEVSLPKDDNEAMKVLQTHPQRNDVRMVVGVLRTGETWSAIRTKQYDDPAYVASQENLVPGVAEALKHTFE